MQKKPNMQDAIVTTLADTKFLHLYDLKYDTNKHYVNASRRAPEDLVAKKSTEEFKKMHADAVTCIVVLSISTEEPKLLLIHEFRYPTG